MTITANQINTWTQEVNHWLDKCEAAIAERDTLRTQNQALLEALKNIERVSGMAAVYNDPVRIKARAAIKLAEGTDV